MRGIVLSFLCDASHTAFGFRKGCQRSDSGLIPNENKLSYGFRLRNSCGQADRTSDIPKLISDV